jgi:gluconokinase
MTAGIPLDDEDRQPWLERVRDALAEHQDVVVACSALRLSHRELLREAGRVTFVFLDLSEATARRRARQRRGHFMGADMIASQFVTLERPTAGETDVVVVDVDRPHDVVLTEVVARVTA